MPLSISASLSVSAFVSPSQLPLRVLCASQYLSDISSSQHFCLCLNVLSGCYAPLSISASLRVKATSNLQMIQVSLSISAISQRLSILVFISTSSWCAPVSARLSASATSHPPLPPPPLHLSHEPLGISAASSVCQLLTASPTSV